MSTEIQRLPAEELFKAELDALIANEAYPVPAGWRMSPRSVLTYIMGGKSGSVQITPKYIGDRRPIEIAISTLLTDRALLLIGEPGTAKSWVSEHLTAAINGNSSQVIQGTAGTTEEQIRYSWNYAMLLAQGPSFQSLVKSPIYNAMETGTIARIEEISRCASEVQDALISLLSEKRISVPELSAEVAAKRGFSVIATANTRDKGVNEMSAALKRRFNVVILPPPPDMETEISIVRSRVEQLSRGMELGAKLPEKSAFEKIVTVFRELRLGQTLDGQVKVKQPAGTLSTAEAISAVITSMALAGSFGTGTVTDEELASAVQGAVVKDESRDSAVWREYLENVLRKKGKAFSGLYESLGRLNQL